MTQLDLSVIVVVHNMLREAPRTLHSLSRAYQRDVGDVTYEVIVVDNGSSADQRLPDDLLAKFGVEFRMYRVANAGKSPARGINEAAAGAKGRLVGVMIDGARILTPRVLSRTMQASRLAQRPVIYTLGWHLGMQIQSLSVRAGYNQSAEEALLKRINWPDDGYRLFEIATQAGNSATGWLAPPGESNCIFVRNEDFQSLGGYDEAFDQPGGGLVNHDFYRRALAMLGAVPICLLGEGSFHQVHGGTTTSADPVDFEKQFAELCAFYQRLRGKPFVRPVFAPLLLGQLPASAARFLRHSVNAVFPE